MKLTQSKVFNEKELSLIDENVRKILKDIGLKVNSKKALDYFKKGGARVDGNVVKISSKLLDKSLKSVPKEFKLFSRERDYFLDIKQGNTFVVNGLNSLFQLDPKKRICRRATKKDIIEMAIVSDYLENINISGEQQMPCDTKKPKSSILHAVYCVLDNSTKPHYFSPDDEIEAKYIIRILKKVYKTDNLSETPQSICQVSTVSPLIWLEGQANAIIECAREGLPTDVVPTPQPGMLSPMTLAATICMNMAESLSGLVLTQIVNPRVPYMLGASWMTFDMRVGNISIGSIEKNLMITGGAQVAKYYNLPTHTIGLDSDAHIYDEQMGFEKFSTLLANMQAGTTVIVNAGQFSGGLAASAAQMVIDNEIIGFIKRFLEGINVDEDTLAYDVIKKVGHDRNYLMEDHTFKYMRSKEFVGYDISNRDVFEVWRNKGSLSTDEKAQKKVKEILQEHHVKPLDKSVKEKIDSIIEEFESRY